MRKKHIYPLVAAVGIVGASTLAWWLQNGSRGPGNTANPGPGGPPRLIGVEVAKVKKSTLRDDAEAVGSLRSVQNVMLRPEVAGRVLGIGFADGARVNAGQVLVQLDDTLQRAEVQQSLAQVAIARANYKRNQELVAQNFVAQRVLEESAASLQVAEAQLGLSCARLDRMRIVAPFGGVVGIRNINIGDFVKDGADLINLEDIGNLYVDYRLPERYQAKVAPGQTVELRIDALPGRLYKAKVEALDPLIDANGPSIGIRATLVNGPGEPISADRKGAATPAQAPASKAEVAKKTPANNPSVTPVVATAKPRVMPNLPSPQSLGCPPGVFDRGRGFANTGAGGPLRPGMFARVTAVFEVKQDALVVPEEAIVPQGGKQFVIKVVSPSDLPAPAPSDASSAASSASPAPTPADAAGVSHRVEVKLGIRRQGQVEITEGLNEDDTVVVAGQQRLQKDGTPVRLVELGRGSGGPGAPSAPDAAASAAPGTAAPAASGAQPAAPAPAR